MTKKISLPVCLAIDTSCDDTSAAVVQGAKVISSVVSSQIALHAPYGGVFPTVAKLAHAQNIEPTVARALARAQLTTVDQLDAVAVTVGPGLAPALEVGINYARQLALTNHRPLLAINHLEGHLWSPLLRPRTSAGEFDRQNWTKNSLGLVISGGHTQFIHINHFGDYQTLGQTLDDAAGECLDKIGRMLNLGYPAAPVVEELAKTGDAKRFPFPLPLTDHHDYNLSFSGLKTFARNLIVKLQTDKQLDRQTIADVCASAQAGVFRHLSYKLDKLLTSWQWTDEATPLHFFIGGGVAQNLALRHQLRLLTKKYPLILHFPYHARFCSDNAAMIGLVANSKISQENELDSQVNTIERQPNLMI